MLRITLLLPLKKNCITELNLHSFSTELNNVKWETHISKDSVDESYNTFLKVFKDFYVECFST